jgi:hypothetical protein
MRKFREPTIEPHTNRRYPNAASLIEAVMVTGVLKNGDRVSLVEPLTPEDIFMFTERLGKREIILHRTGDGNPVLMVGQYEMVERPPESYQVDYCLHTHPAPGGAVSKEDIKFAGKNREFMADAGGVVEYTRSDVSQQVDPFTGQPIRDFMSFRERYFHYMDMMEVVIRLSTPENRRAQELSGITFNRVERWDTAGMQRFMAYINGQAQTFTGTTPEARLKHIFAQHTDVETDASAIASCIIEVAALDFPLFRVGQADFYKQLMSGVSLPSLARLADSLRATIDAAERRTMLIDFANEHHVLIPGVMGGQLTHGDINPDQVIIATLAEAQLREKMPSAWGPETPITIRGKDLLDTFAQNDKSRAAGAYIGEYTSLPIALDKALMLWQLKRNHS